MSTVDTETETTRARTDSSAVETASSATSLETATLAAYLVMVGGLLIYFLVRLWPDAALANGAWKKDVIVFWSADPVKDVSDEVRLLLLVVVAGGLGSFIHAATSFVDYVGNRRFVRSWLLWYVMRPLIGGALAIVLYIAVRGGLLTANAGGPNGGSPNVSPFGVTAIAGLAGMFSKQASDKLNEMFSTLFKTTADGDAARKDKLEGPVKVASVEPAQIRVNTAADLTVNGSGFESASIVRLNGQPKPTTFVSPTKLSVHLSASDVATAGVLVLTVHNTSGQTSAPINLTIA
jgi:hypothetical protein